MKIKNLQLDKVLNSYLRQRETPSAEEKGSRHDRMEISEEAREVKKLADRLKELPEVRREKIAGLKQQVENGDYRVDSKKLARKILSDLRQEIRDEE